MTTHYNFEQVLNAVSDCDRFTKSSVYCSLIGTLNFSCLTQAMRYIPDQPAEGSGIDGYTIYEEAKRQMREEAMNEEEGDYKGQLPALVALRESIMELFEELPKDPSFTLDMGLASSLENMLNRPFDAGVAQTKFLNFQRQGIELYVSEEDFVTAERANHERTHERTKEKGYQAIELIVNLANSFDHRVDGIDALGEPIKGRGYADLDENMQQRLFHKALEKLGKRFVASGTRIAQLATSGGRSAHSSMFDGLFETPADVLAEAIADRAFIAQAIWVSDYVPQPVHDFLRKLQRDSKLPKGIHVLQNAEQD